MVRYIEKHMLVWSVQVSNKSMLHSVFEHRYFRENYPCNSETAFNWSTTTTKRECCGILTFHQITLVSFYGNTFDYWIFVRESAGDSTPWSVDSPKNGPFGWTLNFLLLAWTNCWGNSMITVDFRRLKAYAMSLQWFGAHGHSFMKWCIVVSCRGLIYATILWLSLLHIGHNILRILAPLDIFVWKMHYISSILNILHREIMCEIGHLPVTNLRWQLYYS